MTNTWTNTSCVVTEYTDAEWDFIETLTQDAKRRICMGLATPYDYGYKHD